MRLIWAETGLLPMFHVTDGPGPTILAANGVLDPEPTIKILVNGFELSYPFDFVQCTKGVMVFD